MASEQSMLLSDKLGIQLTFGRKLLYRYKARFSLNKYVLLVLLWNLLIWFTVGVFTSRKEDTNLLVSVVTTVQPYKSNIIDYLLNRLLPSLFLAVAAVSSVWLAGWKYKLSSIMLAGMTVLYLGAVFDTIVHTASFASGSEDSDTWVVALNVVAKLMIAIGTGPCLANIIQLAMEQIPGASTSQLSSIISWMIFSSTLGIWLNSFIMGVYRNCANSAADKAYLPILKLGMTILMTVALAINCLCHSKLLDYSPSSNTTKQIYYILKYAVTNKHPQNTTARGQQSLSRLDNSKRMYGGPFTTEEVEDVKTFLQILGLCIATFLYLTILYLNGYSLTYLDSGSYNKSLHLRTNSWSNCITFISFSFTGQNLWWLLIFILIYELVIVPVFYLKMPRMLCRVGGAAVIAALISVVQTAFLLFDYFSNAHISINPFGPKILLAIAIGLCRAVYYTAGLEFICAQSPYAMRSFFITAAFFIILFSPAVSGLIFTLWNKECSKPPCPVIYTVGMLVIGIVALVIYCIFAKCYRKRSRDDDEDYGYGDTISIT